jgi:c-di-GMP-binding flagellar brake protein YcgR
MTWEGIEKRTRARAEYPCKVIVLRADLRQTFSTHTKNIGVGGMCVVLPKELPKFCPVEILLYLKDGKGSLLCKGRILWTLQRKLSVDTGVEFIDISEADRLRIERVIQK